MTKKLELETTSDSRSIMTPNILTDSLLMVLLQS